MRGEGIQRVNGLPQGIAERSTLATRLQVRFDEAALGLAEAAIKIIGELGSDVVVGNF